MLSTGKKQAGYIHTFIQSATPIATQVKDQLLGKLGLGTQKQEAPKDQGYLNGLGGMITGSNGQTFSMDKLKGDLKEKACDFVLDNAQSLL